MWRAVCSKFAKFRKDILPPSSEFHLRCAGLHICSLTEVPSTLQIDGDSDLRTAERTWNMSNCCVPAIIRVRSSSTIQRCLLFHSYFHAEDKKKDGFERDIYFSVVIYTCNIYTCNSVFANSINDVTMFKINVVPVLIMVACSSTHPYSRHYILLQQC